jgi:hypothetical protein
LPQYLTERRLLNGEQIAEAVADLNREPDQEVAEHRRDEEAVAITHDFPPPFSGQR